MEIIAQNISIFSHKDKKKKGILHVKFLNKQ